jgi:hypothetical protein
MFAKRSPELSRDLIHCALVILTRKQMPIAIHRDLQGRMTRERLRRLGRKVKLKSGVELPAHVLDETTDDEA